LATITKKDLALLVSRSTGCKKNLAAKMVDSLFVAMRDSLIQGNRIEIRGFGVFQVKDTRPKPAARNPRTGEIIYVPARRKTHFKPGRLLKEALHQNRDGVPAPELAVKEESTPSASLPRQDQPARPDAE
jgi:integration host factor subunit beta